MDKKEVEKVYKVSKAIRDISIYWQLIIFFVGSLIGLYTIYVILNRFKVDVWIVINPSITFWLVAIIIAMGRYIVYLIMMISKPNENEKNTLQAESANDSLIEMLQDAEAHSRWAEIIKIGSALSEVLWFTSRKKLRVVIGKFVEIAATQLEDDKTLASTLIEDLGNTIMGLGNPDKGIEYICQGIQIAEKNGYSFLIARGYRNLANCYALKNDAVNSEIYLNKATEAADEIVDEAQKLEALGGIAYARCKEYEHKQQFEDAITSLDNSIEYYKRLGKNYPETESRNKDRLVKVYREKGIIYMKMNKLGLAKQEICEGLRRAQETMNHENIVRCCTMIVKIELDEGEEFQSIEGVLNIAKQHIDKIDTPKIRKEYNDISRRFEVEKESRRYVDA